MAPSYYIAVPRANAQVYGFHLNQNKPNPRWTEKCSVIRCCDKRVGEKAREEKNYYELLGVSVDANLQDIKEAYRKLQKKYHPDIAGQQGHEYTLMLNKAYKVLIKEDLRKDYDASIGQMRLRFGRNGLDSAGYSSWNGPLRPQALFVDENACVGCRECVHHAGNTFEMDEAMGCARVRVQYGDREEKLEVSVESCPVNCIHWVNREELAVLEFLTQPQPKKGYGVFGGGWERPANVFMAAKAFSKQQLNQQSEAQSTVEKETPAQAEARVNASKKLERERFSGVWNFFKQVFHQNM
ncbi:chaperone protein dnaJ C76, chloroplastic-like [Mangifera indica]|uniref:chaperone protein dnaJ C76, chloroplastic-like n=1 Tax=Mangifera indica TaxID=29780 RepID=UPI001CFB478F|nr:chaperone protein dnaJ C76, chloroplastic-like [Mangifera indica]